MKKEEEENDTKKKKNWTHVNILEEGVLLQQTSSFVCNFSL